MVVFDHMCMNWTLNSWSVWCKIVDIQDKYFTAEKKKRLIVKTKTCMCYLPNRSADRYSYTTNVMQVAGTTLYYRMCVCVCVCVCVWVSEREGKRSEERNLLLTWVGWHSVLYRNHPVLHSWMVNRQEHSYALMSCWIASWLFHCFHSTCTWWSS